MLFPRLLPGVLSALVRQEAARAHHEAGRFPTGDDEKDMSGRSPNTRVRQLTG